jgi:hypothetical protein
VRDYYYYYYYIVTQLQKQSEFVFLALGTCVNVPRSVASAAGVVCKSTDCVQKLIFTFE